MIKYGKGIKKYRFPVDLHLKQAAGALTLRTGVGTICNAKGMAIKKANRQKLANIRRLFQMEIAAKVGIIFEYAKGKSIIYLTTIFFHERSILKEHIHPIIEFGYFYFIIIFASLFNSSF